MSEAADRIERYAAFSAARAPLGFWAVEVADTGTVAGTVLLPTLPNGDGEVEVAWFLHPDSWGHGYATEAAAALVDHAVDAGIPEVWALTHVGNDLLPVGLPQARHAPPGRRRALVRRPVRAVRRHRRGVARAQTRMSSSPCSTENQPPGSSAQARQPAAICSTSSAVARPDATSCSPKADVVIRSAHMPPQQARSSAEAKHHVEDEAATSSSPAAWAQPSSRRPASGSPPLARAASS